MRWLSPFEGLAEILTDRFPYAYVTIYDSSDGDSAICEGFVMRMRRILDFSALNIKSFYVTEYEDGGVQIDLRV